MRLLTNLDIIGPMLMLSYLLKKSDVVVRIISGINDVKEKVRKVKRKMNILYIFLWINPYKLIYKIR